MRALIVGSGFIGRAVAARIVAQGGVAVLASRRPPTADIGAAQWIRLDATDPHACAEAVDRTGPDGIVSVHGPSDVTWCEAEPARALRWHTDAAANLAATGRRVVLVSTDNVFDGHCSSNFEDTVTAPANAYGRAKLSAESRLRDAGTVLRVSLVYGWEPANTGKWLNFFAACAHRLRDGEPIEVPDGQWTTPVHVDDVAAVTAAALIPGAPSLLHLGGPDRINRADWAERIAAGFGRPAALVVRRPLAATRYASRPVNTCLSSRFLDKFLAAHGLRVRDVRQGIADLVAAAP